MIDERELLDGFHDALDMEPRPGAFERLQYEFTHAPVALKLRPAPRLRFSKMAFRIAAVAVVAIIAIGLVAALIASHRGPVGNVPAHPDKNVVSYQALINNDYHVMDASTSDHCNTILDTACADAINRVIPTLQKWIGDLQAFSTPPQYAPLDGLLRAHLTTAIGDLNSAIAFQKAGNPARFDLAMNAASYERAWIDPTSFAIEGTYPKVAGTYHDAISLAAQALSNCISGTPAPADLACTSLGGRQCDVTVPALCQSYVQAAASQIQQMLVSLLQNPAPSTRIQEVAALQGDLSKADKALLALTAALLKGDGAAASSAESDYYSNIGTAFTDASAARA